MAQRLLNKVAVVTGASGAIGRCIVGRFLGEGAKVVVFARNRLRLEELAAAAPARVLVVEGDVTRSNDLELLARATVRRFGGVDVLVPAAGIYRPAALKDCTPEFVAEMLDVNLHGALQTVRTLEPHLNSGASIVFLTASPEHALRAGLGPFAASKSALAAIAQNLACELFPNSIRVNCVAPGIGWNAPDTTQPHTAAERSGTRDSALLAGDVAEAVLYLASEAAAGVSGQQLVAAQTRPIV